MVKTIAKTPFNVVTGADLWQPQRIKMNRRQRHINHIVIDYLDCGVCNCIVRPAIGGARCGTVWRVVNYYSEFLYNSTTITLMAHCFRNEVCAPHKRNSTQQEKNLLTDTGWDGCQLPVASCAKCIVFVVRAKTIHTRARAHSYIIRIAVVMFNECVKYVSSPAHNILRIIIIRNFHTCTVHLECAARRRAAHDITHFRQFDEKCNEIEMGRSLFSAQRAIWTQIAYTINEMLRFSPCTCTSFGAPNCASPVSTCH